MCSNCACKSAWVTCVCCGVEEVFAERRDADDESHHRQHRDDADAVHQPAALGGDNAAIDAAPLEFGAQRFFQKLHLRGRGAAIPAGEVFGLECAETEGDFHPVEHHRHKPAFVACAPRFIAHECRSRRTAGPHHDHRLGAAQFAFDDLRIVLPRRQRAIPPDPEAALLQRLGQRPHPIAILAGVGNEDVRHPRTPGLARRVIAWPIDRLSLGPAF